MMKKITPMLNKKMIWEEIGLMLLMMFILVTISNSNFSTMLSAEIIDATVERHYSGVINKIPDINVLLKGIFWTVPVFLTVCIGLVYAHYRSFYQDSMSIYTIRRTGRPWELHVRCFAIPVLLFVLMFIISMLELAGFVATYLNQTPPTYLPEYHGIDFWRLFI